MPAGLARHLECLAGSAAISEGWTVDGIFHGSKSYVAGELAHSSRRVDPDDRSQSRKKAAELDD